MATLTVTVTVNDTEQAIMLNDLTDINQWVQDAVTGKKITVGNVCNRNGLQSL